MGTKHPKHVLPREQDEVPPSTTGEEGWCRTLNDLHSDVVICTVDAEQAASAYFFHKASFLVGVVPASGFGSAPSECSIALWRQCFPQFQSPWLWIQALHLFANTLYH